MNIVRLTRPFTGVGRYIECILNEWAKREQPFSDILLYTPRPVDPSRVEFPLDRYQVQVVGSPAPDPVWEGRDLRRAARECDVLFCPAYTVPFGYGGRCAVTYLGPSENRPLSREWFKTRIYDLLYRYSARHADHVFACSHAVERRVVGRYGVPGDRVSVTYLAASEHFRPITDPAALGATRQRYSLGAEPYILFVGKLARRHYIPELLEAFARVRARLKLPHRLILAGPDYLGLDVPKRAQRAGIARAVSHLPFVPHRELPALYSGAEFFVFPASNAEGFGLPVIEAMACGVPVITTRAGSLPEFASGATVFTESSTAEALEKAIDSLATNTTLRRDLAARGPAQAATITWEKTARLTMEQLARLASG